MSPSNRISDQPAKRKASYVGAPAIFVLERECQLLWAAFCDPDDSYSGIYLVGSALERADWRDVDVRLILGDEFFAKLFPDALLHSAAWEKDPRWLVLTTSIASHLRAATGLPVDFQFQPTKFANERHSGKPRSSLGMRYQSPRDNALSYPTKEPAHGK